MLQMVKLYPDQVSRHWDRISYSIEQALPPLDSTDETEKRMLKILESILSGGLEVFIFVTRENETTTIYGVMTLAVVHRADGTGTELFIHSAYGSVKLSRDIIVGAMSLVKAYAKAKGCGSITALTTSDNVRKILRATGLIKEYTYIIMEV